MSGFAPLLRSAARRAAPALLIAAAAGTANGEVRQSAFSDSFAGQAGVGYTPADRISANLLAGGMSRLAAISAQQGSSPVPAMWTAPSPPVAEAIVNDRLISSFMGKLPGWRLEGVRLSLNQPGISYRQPDVMPSFMREFVTTPTVSAAQDNSFVLPTRPAVLAPARPAPRSGQPDVFGSVALPIGRTTLDSKWASISQPLPARGLWSGLVQAAQQAGGQQQVELINRWVNQRLRFVDDRQGRDQWASASQSLLRGAGDCEDFAIAKMKLLEAAGFDRRAMFLVIARDLVRQADHALLAVRIGNDLMILDNMTDKVLPSSSVGDYRPVMSFNAYGRWTHGYRVTKPQAVRFAAR